MDKPFLKLAGTGTVTWEVRFNKKAYATLTGNTTYRIEGMADGDVLTLIVTQDATGSRTLSFSFPSSLTTAIVGATAAIDSTASEASKVTLTRAGSVVYLEYDAGQPA